MKIFATDNLISQQTRYHPHSPPAPLPTLPPLLSSLVIDKTQVDRLFNVTQRRCSWLAQFIVGTTTQFPKVRKLISAWIPATNKTKQKNSLKKWPHSIIFITKNKFTRDTDTLLYIVYAIIMSHTNCSMFIYKSLCFIYFCSTHIYICIFTSRVSWSRLFNTFRNIF